MNQAKTKTAMILTVWLGVLVPFFAFASTTGFVDKSIKINTLSLIEGEVVSLDVSFVNVEDGELTGKMNFYDGDELIGSRTIQMQSGEEQEFSIDWTVVLGNHSFVAKAENLHLSNASVRILSQSTQPKDVVIGFKNSTVAASLASKGGFGEITAGLLNELYEKVRPIATYLESWRVDKINPLTNSKDRIARNKIEATGKIKAILVVHGIVLSVSLFLVSHQFVFFALVISIVLFALIKLVRLAKRLFRRKYSEE